jgi:Na+/H+ antiporter NhaC
LLTPHQLRKAAFDGARLVLPSLTILWLAWALSGTTESDRLGTGEYLAGLIRDPHPPSWLPLGIADAIRQLLAARWMPTIVFVLASLVAFSTGTSWGTMGILMPIVVSTTYSMLADQGSADPHHPLMIATIGSVLAGAIFGDHCSPISDTTVLSAQASGCDHLAHVRTQMPYALFVAAVSIVCGTIPVGLGAPLVPILILGVVVMAAGLWIVGRRP